MRTASAVNNSTNTGRINTDIAAIVISNGRILKCWVNNGFPACSALISIKIQGTKINDIATNTAQPCRVSLGFANPAFNNTAHSHTILDALHTPKLSSLSKDDNNKWLLSVLLIGKKVEVQASESALYENKGLSGSVLVTQAATNIQVSISDSNGDFKKTLDLGSANTPGLLDFIWNGVLPNGNPAGAGFYTISASATVNGVSVPLMTAGDFKVRSVALDATNRTILNVDDLGGVYLDDIIKVL